MKHKTILITKFFDNLSLKKIIPHRADATMLPPVTKGYNTDAGSDIAPQSCIKYEPPPKAADAIMMNTVNQLDDLLDSSELFLQNKYRIPANINLNIPPANTKSVVLTVGKYNSI